MKALWAEFKYAALLLALAGTFWYGTHVGADGVVADQAREEQKMQEVEDRAQKGAAAAIANNKPKVTYVQGQLERETRVVPDYSLCQHSPDGLRYLNSLLENRPVAAGDSGLPGADTPR